MNKLDKTINIMINRNFSIEIFDSYDSYSEKRLMKLNHKHAEIVPLIQELGHSEIFSVSIAGQSVEGRDIYTIKIGDGKTKVMLWSQMHGNEPTATKAIFDVLNFLKSTTSFQSEIKTILANTTLCFVPMVNPDGAERFVRENALGVDLNRDARLLQMPESRLLKSVRDDFDANFGFNLHDQRRNFGAKGTDKPATISFLAPTYNEEKDINELRLNSMKVIAQMYSSLEKIIPGHTAKFSDDFEPRAFGDNIQKWGTSTILIESGGYFNDYKKEFIRKLNFTIILDALYSIATNDYQRYGIEHYSSIPNNKLYVFDLLIKNATLTHNANVYKTDLAIFYRSNAFEDEYETVRKSRIESMGDMLGFAGYHEFDATGLTVAAGKIHTDIFDSIQDVDDTQAENFLRNGITTVRLNKMPDKEIINETILDFISSDVVQNNELLPGNKACFVFEDNNNVVAAVVNGKLINLKQNK